MTADIWQINLQEDLLKEIVFIAIMEESFNMLA